MVFRRLITRITHRVAPAAAAVQASEMAMSIPAVLAGLTSEAVSSSLPAFASSSASSPVSTAGTRALVDSCLSPPLTVYTAVSYTHLYDVAVDCRPNSAAFGKWVGVTLSEENKKMFYIPEGFAHGFLVLSDVAEFCYKCTDVYDPTSEGGIPYDCLLYTSRCV